MIKIKEIQTWFILSNISESANIAFASVFSFWYLDFIVAVWSAWYPGVEEMFRTGKGQIKLIVGGV